MEFVERDWMHTAWVKKSCKNPETLVLLCLNCITKHFKIFMDVYFNSKTKPTKEFEYLQRTHSLILFDKVSTEYGITPYVEFLLNRHLKHVDLEFEDCTNVTIINRLKVIGPTIESLRFIGDDLTHENSFLELIPSLINLETLILDDVDFSVNVLISVRKYCRILKKLDLSHCDDVTDDYIDAFCIGDDTNDEKILNASNTLQYLDVSYTSITIVGIACALKNLPNLIMINHNDLFHAICYFYFNNLKNNPKSCSKTYNLQNLQISNINDFHVEFIEICSSCFPNITVLKVFEINTQSQIDSLLKFTKLIEVDFRLSSASIDLIPFMKDKGKYLEILKIYQGNVSADNLINFCKKLKYLYLTKTNFLPIAQFDSVPSFHHLQKLELDKLNFRNLFTTESIAYILSNSYNLEKLSFSNCDDLNGALSQFLTTCHCMNNLKQLMFKDVEITYSVVETFMLKAPNLQSFEIIFCNLIVENIEKLNRIKNSCLFIMGTILLETE